MRLRLAAVWLSAIALGGAAPVFARSPYGASGGVGSLVSVSLEVDGRATPLYPAPDGSGRYYLEAWRGARYAVRLANRTGERLGVLLTVDGLNAISGERSPAGPRSPGRMYVLYRWDDTVVQGWRTSLEDVRQFTFVDEERSYAMRSGKAGRHLGWIEVEVYRELRPVARPWPYWPYRPDGRPDDGEPREEGRREPKAKDDSASAARDGIAERAPAPPATAAPSYPGTGWGPRAEDPVRVVSFDPEPAPAERITLRYEYASALRALGILPRSWWTRDRLRDRERGDEGFARPPIH